MTNVVDDADRSREGSTIKDHLFDLGFFLVEAFAALEVTAVIVANARITEGLGLQEEFSSYIISSYLYPLFAVMFLILLLSRYINRTFSPTSFFLAGLLLFAIGNLVCFSAVTPLRFFCGRFVMGIGGALSFAGQLWTLSVFQRRRITKTLVWGEAGTALGVVAGPLVGAMFAQFSPEGWRSFFLLNSGLGLITALFAYLSLRNRRVRAEIPDKVQATDPHGRRATRIMTAWQVIVSILIVGAEYLFSDYLQAKMGKSPMFVGGMTVLASVGAILGSIWAGKMENRMEKLPAISASGLLLALAVLALCLSAGAVLPAGIPIFAAGLFMGLASVSIYSCIVHLSSPDQFLTRSMVYLMGMQIGNALGVQAVGMAEYWHLNILATAGLLAALPLTVIIGILGYSRNERVKLPELT